MSNEPGVWEPSRSVKPDIKQLSLLAARVQSAASDDLDGLLSEAEVKELAPLMKQEESAWQIADELDSVAVEALIRFFTLAETKLSGWSAGNQSPVIPLVKILRARDAFPASLRKWIKANTDNRWLPNGSAL